jgi:hypothetical protein
MKKFTTIVLENKNTQDKYKTILKSIKEFITKTINNEDEEKVREFINEYLVNPDNIWIEGLINDNDVYDFYIKNTSDIDEVLTDISHFKNAPDVLGIFSLYTYTVYSTRIAVTELIKLL